MNEKYLIGVDLGTSGTKAGLYSVDGKLIAQANQDVPLYYPKPGEVEQENDDFYRTAAQTVRECIQRSGIDPHRIAAIAFDSQMAGIGSIDQDYHPATRFDSWLDMRCEPYIKAMDEQGGDRVTELTGGDSLASNIELVLDNARLGAAVAAAFAAMRAVP